MARTDRVRQIRDKCVRNGRLPATGPSLADTTAGFQPCARASTAVRDHLQSMFVLGRVGDISVAGATPATKPTRLSRERDQQLCRIARREERAMSDTEKPNAAAEKKQKGPPFKPKPRFFFELSRLMVVAIKGGNNGQLVSRAQTKPNGPWEPNWTPVEKTQTFNAMAAGLTGDGRVAIVAQPTSNAGVLYIDQNLATPKQEWNTPINLGKPGGITQFYFLATAYDTDGRVEVFGTDTNHGIWWKYQNPSRIVQKTIQVTPPGTHTPITVTVNETAPPQTPWSDWFKLPGGLGQLKALRGADGGIILFGTNPGGNLYRSEQKVAKATQPSDWTGWVQMDTKASSIIQLRTMAPVLDKAGAVNLFVIGAGSHKSTMPGSHRRARKPGPDGARPAKSGTACRWSAPASTATTILLSSVPTTRSSTI